MRNFEDQMVERKTVKDEKDWKRAAVAFANSAPIGYPALLYIGVRDNGEIENPQKDLEEVAKKFNSQMQKVYPRIAYVPKVISSDGRQALAVIIPGSESRPHFAGPAYVRRGPESVDASEEQFAQLIAQRNSKAAFLLGWKGKNVTVFTRMGDDELAWPNDTCLVDCNQFYVSLHRGVISGLPVICSQTAEHPRFLESALNLGLRSSTPARRFETRHVSWLPKERIDLEK